MRRSTLRIGWGAIGAWITWTWMSGHNYWFLFSTMALIVCISLASEDWEQFKRGWFD